MRDLSKNMDTELITYGRLPLMIMENCIIKNRTGSCGCQNTNILTDRKGARFPVVSAPGCRNELFNSQKLFLADKAADYRRIGLWAQRLMFTTENPRECVQVARRYLEQGTGGPPTSTPVGYTIEMWSKNMKELRYAHQAVCQTAGPTGSAPRLPDARRSRYGSVPPCVDEPVTVAPGSSGGYLPRGLPSPCPRRSRWPWCSPAPAWASSTALPSPTGWGSSTATTGGRSGWG